MNNRLRSLGLMLLAGVFAGQGAVKAAEILPESDEAYAERMEWFTDAKFGLFIHYGLYSILGGEWKGEPVPRYAEWIQCWGNITPEEYIPLAPQFSPENLDADQWVKAARDAGMKYMVITTKHHEGFCLWDSAFTEYDLGDATDFDRDILGELKAACDKYGLKFGTYYSIIDWNHPSQRADEARHNPPMRDKAGYVAYMKAQLKELIDRYDPAVMWFDGDWTKWWTMEDGIDLYNYLRELSPDLIINNRAAKRKQFKKDFGTPENFTPGAALDHIWEACWTVNHSWGFKKSDTNWKSNEVLVRKLIDITTKGGNLLLNVGPHADGSWPDAAFGQLGAMGGWIAAYPDSIYEAEFVPVSEPEWGRMAQLRGSDENEGELLAYIFDWPESGELKVRGVSAGKIEAYTYDGNPLPAKPAGNDTVVDLSSVKKNEYATVLRLKYSGGLMISKVSSDLELQGDELILKAGEAALSGGVKLSKDGVAVAWRKKTDAASWTMNVPAPGKFRVKLYCGYEFRKPTEVTLKVGEQELKAPVPAKGAKDNLKILDIGEIELNDVGGTVCTVQFGNLSGNAKLSLKTVYFVPIGK